MKKLIIVFLLISFLLMPLLAEGDDVNRTGQLRVNLIDLLCFIKFNAEKWKICFLKVTDRNLSESRNLFFPYYEIAVLRLLYLE